MCVVCEEKTLLDSGWYSNVSFPSFLRLVWLPICSGNRTSKCLKFTWHWVTHAKGEASRRKSPRQLQTRRGWDTWRISPTSSSAGAGGTKGHTFGKNVILENILWNCEFINTIAAKVATIIGNYILWKTWIWFHTNILKSPTWYSMDTVVFIPDTAHGWGTLFLCCTAKFSPGIVLS